MEAMKSETDVSASVQGESLGEIGKSHCGDELYTIEWVEVSCLIVHSVVALWIYGQFCWNNVSSINSQRMCPVKMCASWMRGV